jgi:hypothetical protein
MKTLLAIMVCAIPLLLLAQQPRRDDMLVMRQEEQEREYQRGLVKRIRVQGNSLIVDPAAAQEYEQTRADIERIAKITDELRTAMASHDANVVSLDSMRRTEELEKLAKRVRIRMRGWR